jgi:hypothetical protein
LQAFNLAVAAPIVIIAIPSAAVPVYPDSFWVQDASGQTVGWFYFRHHEETARQAKVV